MRQKKGFASAKSVARVETQRGRVVQDLNRDSLCHKCLIWCANNLCSVAAEKKKKTGNQTDGLNQSL